MFGKMMVLGVVAILGSLILVACGSDNMPSRDAYLDQLSTSQKDALCDWGTDNGPAAGTTDCGGGLSVTIKTASDCKADTTPALHCTVGALEDCWESMKTDVCNPTGCTAYYACL